MIEDTKRCLLQIIDAIEKKDKLRFENNMTAFYIKAKRDINANL